MMNRKRFAYCVLGAILALVFAFSGSSAQAGSISFQTVNGQQGDGPVSAQADFTTLSGQVKIVLTDLYQNPKAAGQLISGITFTVSGATGNASISSAKGMTSNIADGGAYSPTGPNNLTHWGVSGKTTVTLEPRAAPRFK